MGETSSAKIRMRPQRRGRKGTLREHPASIIAWATLAGHPWQKAFPEPFPHQ